MASYYTIEEPIQHPGLPPRICIEIKLFGFRFDNQEQGVCVWSLLGRNVHWSFALHRLSNKCERRPLVGNSSRTHPRHPILRCCANFHQARDGFHPGWCSIQLQTTVVFPTAESKNPKKRCCPPCSGCRCSLVSGHLVFSC